MKNATMTLDAKLDTSQCETLKSQLQQVLENTAEKRVLNASAVEILSTSALQLLLAFARHSESLQRPCEITDPSKQFCEAMLLLGMDHHLKPWITHHV